MPQTSTAATLATAGGAQFTAGNAGQIADEDEAQVSTRVNQNATAIDFGVAVAIDVSSVDQGCKPWDSDSAKFAGISVRRPIMPASSDGFTVNYPQYETVPLLRDGTIYVQSAEAVRAGDQVLIITAGGSGSGNATAGALGGSKGGVAGTGRIALPGMDGIWLDTTAAGGIGRVRIKSNAGVRTTT